MLADVAAALASSSIDDVLVVAAGREACLAAEAVGLAWVADPPDVRGLDAALAAAGAGLPDRTASLVVAADLPRLTGADVDAVLAVDHEVVVAPSAGGGTGGLLRRPHRRISTAYGADSAARHLALARAAGATHALVQRAGFLHDVDTAGDLTALHDAEGLGRSTTRVVATLAEPVTER